MRVWILALIATGCLFARKAPDAGVDADQSKDVPLQVINRNWLDVTIYVIHDGQRTRLGVAGGSDQTAMVLPSRLLGVGRELQLYGDPIGSSERAVTDVLVIQPGQFIQWLLEPGLDHSTVGVY
jgi:hypothetical protein